MKADIFWYLMIFIIVVFFAAIISYVLVNRFFATDDYGLVWTFSHIIEFLIIVPLFISKRFVRFTGKIKLHNSEFLIMSTIAILLILSISLSVGGVVNLLLISDTEHEKNVSAMSNHLFSTILICTTVPILEEIVFRGAVLRRMLESKAIRPSVAILLSSFIFGLSHLNLAQTVSGTAVGIFLGWIFYYTRNLYLTIVVHSAYNMVISVGKYFSENTDETILQTTQWLWILAICLIVSSLLFILLRKKMLGIQDRSTILNSTL